MKFLKKILDYYILRYLAYRSSQHLHAGFPQLVTFAFDHISQEINVKGRFEGDDLEVIFKFLESRSLIHGLAVDVGANIGNHSLFFANYFDEVISLEPNPRIYELLFLNSKLKDNIFPLNIGASDRCGKAQLFFGSSNLGGGQLEQSGEIGLGNILVDIKKLDDLEVLSDRNINLIKIDVEGHELSCLKGAAKQLVRSKPTILFEQHSDEIINGSSAVIDWLREHGYSYFYEVQSYPSLPRAWQFSGRKAINSLLRIFLGESKRIVPITKFDKSFYPMIVALDVDKRFNSG